MSALALRGGQPVRTDSYPSWPVFDERDVEAVSAAVRSGRWGGSPYPGPYQIAFGQRFSAMQGGGHPVMMMNGTITMEVALRAAGIGWGDEVIVPAYTFQATAYAPMAAGAIPVIVDIDAETLCIDPRSVEAAITDKTRAVIVVHLAAQMTDMDAILDLAQRHDLIVIEDCAHAHGAQWRGQGSGTLGDFGSFSLHSAKSITTGEGGILLCRDPKMAETAASIIDCGRPKDSAGEAFTMGINYRWSELQASLGAPALDRFPSQLEERAKMADYLEECLSDLPGIRLLKRDLRQTRRNLYRYVFRMDPDVFGCKHDVFCRALVAEGLPVDTGYPVMTRYDLFQPQKSRLPVPSAFPSYFEFDRMHFPVTEQAAEVDSVWMKESMFRAGTQGIDDLVAGVLKLAEHRDELIALSDAV